MFGRTNPRTAELHRLTPFAACSPKELEDVARLSDDVRLPEGTVLMREGAVGRECFVIAEGEAVVTIDGDEIAKLGPGEIVGEMSLLDRGPRSATVTAATPLKAVVMSTLQFAAITDECTSVAFEVMETLAQRLREFQSSQAA
jgi:CRP-like cAMP-binding protein